MDYVMGYIKNFGLVKANFIEVLKNSFNFKGRLDRTKYWTFYVFILVIDSVLSSISAALSAAVGGMTAMIISAVVGLIILILGVMSLAPTACRMRDAGFSPWIMLSYLLCGIGTLVCFIMCFFPTKGDSAPAATTAEKTEKADSAPEQPQNPQA